MERTVTHVGSVGGGGSSGVSVASTLSREEVVMEEEQCSNSNMGLCSHEVSSYPDEAELELGLGLSLGGGASGGAGLKGGVVDKQQRPRILTAKDLPSMGLRALKSSPPSASSSSSPSLGGAGCGGEANHHAFSSAGTKRAAETSPTRISSQVVGWPPVRASRMNSLSNQAKIVATGEVNSDIGKSKGKGVTCTAVDANKANHNDDGHMRGSLYVKVNMDGIGIGRKIDLSTHSSYESLAQMLEEMFTIPARSDTLIPNVAECGVNAKTKRPSKLLDGLSDFVITYEDKDGDWMLVGDVPWGLFLSTVKRLRIMKTSEAKGLNK